METFAELVESRKTWLEEILKPWCRNASRTQLRLAEMEWQDIAGRISPEKSLWLWAWSRFPELVHEELGIEESRTVRVTLIDGRTVEGFPDARESEQGQLVLYCKQADGKFGLDGPFSIDDIVRVDVCDEPPDDGSAEL